MIAASGTGATGGAGVVARGVTVRYAGTGRAAVDGVDLDVAAGELVVLLGPSGCGKSTLLRTLNRLVAPDAGTVTIGGRDVAAGSAEDLRRGIGYVIQAVGLFPHLSVARNVAVVPELLGWSAAAVRERVDELLALVRLEPARYRDRLPRELSGGEQQRVGVARALAARPRVLLMDEPFGAVDAIVRAALQDETRRIHRMLGTTILFVTHDVDEALRMADRIVVMRDGRIEQADAPLRMLAHPATAYVRELLGADDTVRRLGLLRAGDAMAHDAAPHDAAAATSATGAPGDGTPRATLDADATLREALSRLLGGDDALAVVRDGRAIGALTLADVRRAIAATQG